MIRNNSGHAGKLAAAGLGVWLALATGVGAQEPPASPHKELVRRFNAVCNERSFAKLDDLVLTTFTRHCQATPTVSVKSLVEFKTFLSADASTFPDAHVTFNQLIEEGDRVAFWGQYTGTQKGAMGPFEPSNKKVMLDVSGVFRIEGGKIAELWITWDNMSVFTQLELKPSEQAPKKDHPKNE